MSPIKMASSRCFGLGTFSKLSLKLLPGIAVTKQATRSIFSSEILGLDSYHRFATSINDRLHDMKDKFIPRMEEYMKNEENVVFSEDLKNMLVIAETDKDLSLTERMIKRFYTKSGDMTLNQFTFGPVIMRMLHYKNNPEMALKLFNDPELQGLFSPFSAVLVLMDMLYEDKLYNEAIAVFNDYTASRPQHSRFVYPTDLVTLALAIYYKINTTQSLSDAKHLVTKLYEERVFLTNRGAAFLCQLCLNHNDAVYGYEILNSLRTQKLNTIRNLKVQCLTQLRRLEEAMHVLSGILHNVSYDERIRGNEVFQGPLDQLEQAIAASASDSLTQQFQMLKQNLTNGGHISSKSLAEYTEEEIRHPPGRYRTFGNYNQRPGNFNRFNEAPGGREFGQPWRRPYFPDDVDGDWRRGGSYTNSRNRHGYDDGTEGGGYGQRMQHRDGNRFPFRRSRSQDMEQ